MLSIEKVLFICFVLNGVTCSSISDRNVQIIAVQNLIFRIVGQSEKMFEINVDPDFHRTDDQDTFMITSNHENTTQQFLKITGTSGVAAAAGFHYYLKTFCRAHVSWDFNQLNMTSCEVSGVNTTISFNDKYRYYQNACTQSYSFVWWDWQQWQRHLDWMMMQGFNLIPVMHDQEETWFRVYQDLGLSIDEINAHFTGPAFIAWNRMGNLRGFGGPLPTSWLHKQAKLAMQIIEYLQHFGVTIVRPAFAGQVPKAVKRLFPNSTFYELPQWNDFVGNFSPPLLLDPTDELFQKISDSFLNKSFHVDNAIFSCDTFNEMTPFTTDLQVLRQIGQAIYKGLTNTYPDAIWLLQGWLFHHERLYWTSARAEAFLTSVPLGKMIVLDLQSEQFPQYERLNSYFGQPFIWCMLHNFGGTLGMFGSSEIVNQRPFIARNTSGFTMIGMGITPEGIDQNYMIYDLMTEMFWRTESIRNLSEWVSDYATRRYGQFNELATNAWQILQSTVYNFKSHNLMRGKFVYNRSPSTKLSPWSWYNHKACVTALGYLAYATELHSNPNYRHDAIDLSRQVLQNQIDDLYPDLIQAFRKKDVLQFRIVANYIMGIIDDIESTLLIDEKYLLGKWIQDAIKWADNETERALYEYNARNQITLWGPDGQISDYANKQWSGMVKDYFRPRWELFLSHMNESLTIGVKFDEQAARRDVFEKVEQPFTFANKTYPTEKQVEFWRDFDHFQMTFSKYVPLRKQIERSIYKIQNSINVRHN